MQKWFLPVGLYPDQMDKVQDLHNKLRDLGLETGNLNALEVLLDYFKGPNQAYDDMKRLDEIQRKLLGD